MIRTASPPPVPDARRAVDDGRIWPNVRREMTDIRAIRERMMEDAEALVREGGEDAVVDVQDLIGLGWGFEQFKHYGIPVFADLREREAARRHREASTRHDEAGDRAAA